LRIRWWTLDAVQKTETRPCFPSYPGDEERIVGLHERPHIDRVWVAVVSATIALVCAFVLTLQIRERWLPPEIKSPDQAAHATTGQVAQAAGARILPSDPPLSVEPAPAAPKQAQPANPQ
jgi:hypothetical protein